LSDLPGCLSCYTVGIAILARLSSERRKSGMPLGGVIMCLANAYQDKATACGEAGDFASAADLLNEAIRLYGGLAEREARGDIAAATAMAHLNMGHALRQLSQLDSAITHYTQSIAGYQDLVGRGRGDLVNHLAIAHTSKGQALDDPSSAVKEVDAALAILRSLTSAGRDKHRSDVGKTLTSKGLSLMGLGQTASAACCFDEAITVLECLVDQESRREWTHYLAHAIASKAYLLLEEGGYGGAIELYERAIALLEQFVEREGRTELGEMLRVVRQFSAVANMRLGSAFGEQGNFAGAISLLDEAIQVFENSANAKNGHELSNDWAEAYIKKANALQAIGDIGAAVASLDKAIRIRATLVEEEGHTDKTGDLARALLLRAIILKKTQRIAEARSDGLRAMALLMREIEQSGRTELRSMVDWGRQQLSDVLR
jgi:tetratricopeptide (TPR) repeat protein